MRKKKKQAQKEFDTFIFNLQKNTGRVLSYQTKSSMWKTIKLKNLFAYRHAFDDFEKIAKHNRPDIKKEMKKESDNWLKNLEFQNEVLFPSLI